MLAFPNRRAVLGSLAAMPLIGCAAPPSMTGWPMPTQSKPSVTYLRPLAKTPFFVGLSPEQLQWVIDHSREWSVVAGSEISSSALGPDNFWVLLDGGWQVEQGGTVVKAGHADPAKWYGGAEMNALKLAPTRLVSTATGYVMNIRQADLDDMRRRGFAPFEPHLQAGLQFYRTTFK